MPEDVATYLFDSGVIVGLCYGVILWDYTIYGVRLCYMGFYYPIFWGVSPSMMINLTEKKPVEKDDVERMLITVHMGHQNEQHHQNE